jgi:hypothetical protein
MIITDPALAAIQASFGSLSATAVRRSRLRFWARRQTQPALVADAYYATQFGSAIDADLAVRPAGSLESGGARVHVIARNSTHAR